MSNPQSTNTPALFSAALIAGFIAANGTTAKILVDQFPAAAATTTSPLFYGGCSVIDLKATSSDSAPKDILLWVGALLTTVGAATSTAATTTSTVTRALGSFLTDGWQIGEQVMLFGPVGSANASDGILAQVTGVAAGTLTVNGTPFSAGTLNAGTRIFKIGSDLRATLAALSGASSGVPSVGLLNHVNDGSVIRYEQKLGLNEVLIGAMQSAVSALPCSVSLTGQIARY